MLDDMVLYIKISRESDMPYCVCKINELPQHRLGLGRQNTERFPVDIKIYFINKMMFLRKRSMMWAGQTKFPGLVWQASPTLSKKNSVNPEHEVN